MSRRAAHHGFTLLELILAMALVSMLALSLYTSLQIGLKTRERALDRAAPVTAGEEAMEMIRKDLEAALPPTGLMAVNSMGFYGESQQQTGSLFCRLGFLCVGDGPMHADPTGQGGMRRVVFEVLPDGNGKFILFRRIYSNLLTQIEVPPDDEVICRGVKIFDIQYYDASGTSGSIAWLTDWDSSQFSNTLPMAVQINLELEYPGKRGEAPIDYIATRTYMLPCYQDPTTVVNNTTSTALGAASSGKNNTGNNNRGSTGGSTGGGASTGGVGGSTGGSRGGGK